MNPTPQPLRSRHLLLILKLIAIFLIPSALPAAEAPANRILSDVAYKTGDTLTDYETERCKLDVYLPDSGENWPVLVWFHGGGLKAGDKRGTPTDGVKPEFMATSLAKAGVAVVCPNYRFSPTVKFPAYLEDAAASVAWAKQNLAKHGADVEQLFIGGHSAGGWITFMLGLDSGYLETAGLSLDEIAGLIPVSGQTITHTTVREERGFGRYTLVADEAAPGFHVRKDTPPMLVIYADNDMLARADENELLVEMMKGAGNKGVRSLKVADRNHGTIASKIADEDDPARNAILEFMSVETPSAKRTAARIDAVMKTPGVVAFWDFVKREQDEPRRFTAHVPPGAATEYPLDAGNYIKDFWGAGREATYADFPLLGRGPFGEAIQIKKERNPNFRPFLFIPRSRLHDTPLDIKGEGKSVTVVVWAIRESGNHALAGIWHEGTDLVQKETTGIQKVERGQRQYALFAGLNKTGSACGHVSENGASSFLNKYALHKCNSAALSPAVPADSPADVLDASWQCFAMTFDNATDELTGWLNGVSGDRWLENPKKDGLIKSAYKAYLQGHYNRLPGLQPGEDPNFPKDQYYLPPEDEPVAVEVLRETADERVERRDYRFTKIEVTLKKDADGKFSETSRDLVALRLNPWWYPHGIYTPKDATSGGPFTIGRVIHSSRSVGFTGWIGGVAVFDRALTAEEMGKLTALTK
tara:strand:+ start:7322 stop:9418 length:2097 start_codon:yes stop_codon:yes gene_type:complete